MLNNRLIKMLIAYSMFWFTLLVLTTDPALVLACWAGTIILFGAFYMMERFDKQYLKDFYNIINSTGNVDVEKPVALLPAPAKEEQA